MADFEVAVKSTLETDRTTAPLEEAKRSNYEGCWQQNLYEELEQQVVANKLFDFAVNMPAKEAHKLLQKAIRYLGRDIAVDGIMGPQTIRAANELNRTRLLKEFRTQAAYRYARIAIREPKKRGFLKGWMRRVMG